LNNWLVYRDDNGQLIGWITCTENNKFEVCRLNNSNGNRFAVLRGYSAYSSYQDAVDFVIGRAK
jgi:hypothetical protein